ncbi:phosphatidylserine decarboxylase [Shigella flexneri]
MPADGAISQLGKSKKIKSASQRPQLQPRSLAGRQLSMADLFRNGTFVTTYLSPRDYHRVHMPCNGIRRDDLRAW